MLRLRLVVVVALALASRLQCAAALRMSADQCASAGYSEGLLCSSCATLARFELDHMQAECLECCEDDGLAAAATPQRYAKAVLEMCRCKMGAYPQIVPFIDDGKMANVFANMQFKHVHLAPPRLKMYNSDNKLVEILNIEKWDTDTVTAYLNERLTL